jgi:hypothetical protein
MAMLAIKTVFRGVMGMKSSHNLSAGQNGLYLTFNRMKEVKAARIDPAVLAVLNRRA